MCSHSCAYGLCESTFGYGTAACTAAGAVGAAFVPAGPAAADPRPPPPAAAPGDARTCNNQVKNSQRNPGDKWSNIPRVPAHSLLRTEALRLAGSSAHADLMAATSCDAGGLVPTACQQLLPHMRTWKHLPSSLVVPLVQDCACP